MEEIPAPLGDVYNPMNNGIFWVLTGAGYLPSTVRDVTRCEAAQRVRSLHAKPSKGREGALRNRYVSEIQ